VLADPTLYEFTGDIPPAPEALRDLYARQSPATGRQQSVAQLDSTARTGPSGDRLRARRRSSAAGAPTSRG
jgi:hypothetical protein